MKLKYALIASFFFLLVSCGKFESKKNPIKIIDDFGIQRNYKLYINDRIKNQPLFVYFHGVVSKEFKEIPTLKNYTGSPVEETGLIEFCKEKGIALLVPEPSYSFRFLGKKAKGWSPFVKEANGVLKMIEKVIENYSINRKRVFLLGISAGAVFSHYLANLYPNKFAAILSHSQGYTDEKGNLLIPQKKGPMFGVVFAYTKGDYKNLKKICKQSYNIYKKRGYRTILLKNLPENSHKWCISYNNKFYISLLKTIRK